MLKILQVRLQHYVNWELPDIQAGIENAEEAEVKLPESTGSQKKEITEKNLLPLHWLGESFCVDHNKLWKILQEMEILHHLYLYPEKLDVKNVKK